jgi:hypothetical protein
VSRHHTVGLGGLTFPEARGLYDYHSQGADELDVSEGARIELTSGPSGGRNYADGWWEGEQPGVLVKIFLCGSNFSQELMRWVGRAYSLATM